MKSSHDYQYTKAKTQVIEGMQHNIAMNPVLRDIIASKGCPLDYTYDEYDATPYGSPQDPLPKCVFVDDYDNDTDKGIGYAFTVNVSPKKRLIPMNTGTMHVVRGQLWGNLSKEWQKCYLLEMIRQSGKYLKDWTLNLEQTKAGHYHAHGYITNTHFNDIILFQNDIHSALGMPKLSPDICCYIEPTYWNRKKWDEYQLKGKGPTYSSSTK